ncbi:hypothetical protein L7F22_001440 [Adiantum nelumboides]|nr:hypothetical protein [Adiantum nelumboides]
MVGIDIDKTLIYKAKNLLEKTAEGLANGRRNEKSDLQGRVLNREGIQVASSTTSIDHSSGTLVNGLSGEDLLRRVSFRAKNFIQQIEVEPSYDAVLCLSVTKWVHLNWGDDGLIRLFVKIRNLLRPGGILILEPQPWKSYTSNYMVSEVARKNYHEIVLRPDQFREILLDRVGFRSMQSITEEIEFCAEAELMNCECLSLKPLSANSCGFLGFIMLF